MKDYLVTKIERVAIIGCGVVSKTHIKSILSEGRTICALCDIEKSKAISAAVKNNLENCGIYDNYIEMLDNEKIDCVHICTPHYLHREMVCAALSRNIHVLCEKPLCISPWELEEIKEACENSSAQLGVCFQNRYLSTIKYIKENIANEAIGGYATVVWKRDDAYYASGTWRGKIATEGGGVLINQAIHTLDLLIWLFGYPTKIFATTNNYYHQDSIEAEDASSIYMENDKGQRYQLFATIDGISDFPVTLNIATTDQSIYTVQNKVLLKNGIPVLQEDRLGFGEKMVWGIGHNLLIADFYSKIENGEEFPIGFEEASKTVLALSEIYKR